MTLQPAPALSPADIAKLAAVDSDFYAHAYFPKTARLASAPFHREIDERLENPNTRYVNLVLFRGSAKTTKLRLFASKRIAFARSHTIFYVGASDDHAARSVRWIRNAVERNLPWAQTFGLRPGSKWTDTDLEIIHGLDDRPIWVHGAGITGNVRGINFDDYRPDLIILDDVITDEGASTLDQREKTDNLILSAIKDSLTTEEPNAKMAMLQTPIHPEDACAKASKDPEWSTFTFPCWTAETLDLPIEQQMSSWEAMFPTEALRKKKQFAIQRNKFSLFAREMECRLVSPELSSFKTPWIRLFDLDLSTFDRKGLMTTLTIDPVPPPTPAQMAKQLRGKDSEAHAVCGRRGGEYFVLETRENKGHQPNWTVTTALELALKWRVNRIRLLAVAYETVLEGMLKVEMARRGIFWMIEIIPTSNRSKFDRITANLSGTASQGLLWVNSALSTFLQQYSEYGPTYTGHDDVLEAAASGIGGLVNPYLELGPDEYSDETEVDSKFTFRRRAP